MPKVTPRTAPTPPPSPAARVLYGAVWRVAHKPDRIDSPVTAALQKIAKTAKSQIAPRWAVFPVQGHDLVVVGYLSARTPQAMEQPWAIEPGAPLAAEHRVTPYALWPGATVGRQHDDRTDADCVEPFTTALSATPAWQGLGATPFDGPTLPGGRGPRPPERPALSPQRADDGHGADVVLGMSFWRDGNVYEAGRVDTWRRPVGDDVARVVGVRVARVDRDHPLVLAPERQGAAASALHNAVVAETRAVLDSPRPFAWYFIADAAA